MMAKITKGSSLGGCVRYVMTKKDAQLIAANGVLYANYRTIAESFNLQAELNPRLGKKVGHISLNFSAQDKEKIDNAFMRGVAREYMQKMGIADTQYIIVRHNDREHPHCHIVFNRVSNSGKTISDQNDRLRSVKACREITKRHGLYLKETNAKQDVKREQLRGPDKIKYEIHDAIKATLPHCTNWNNLRKQLEKDGISVTYKFKGNTGEKEGVIFRKNDQSFNGSKVDRQFSFSKLDATLNNNAQKLEEVANPKVTATVERQTNAQASTFIPERQSPNYPRPDDNSYRENHSGGTLLGGLFDIQPGLPEDPDDSLLKELRKKKKKKPQIKPRR